jgi:Contractile injection system tube protein
MELDDVLLAKLTIEPYLDQEFTRPAGAPWQALFNPTELAFSRKNNYNTTPSAGASQPQTSYGGGEPDQVSLDLFFDGTGVVESLQSVRERVEALLELAAFQGDTHQPYYLHAHWGPFEFRGVLTQADVTYTLFDRSGEPLRAKVKITLQEVVAPEPLAAEEGRESPDLYQSWLVEEGQRLEHIAFAVYGSADFWRPLAEANGLRNPRALIAGQTLVLPPLAAEAP